LYPNTTLRAEVKICYAARLHKIVTSVFFEAANSYHYIRLILMPLFREIKEGDKT